MRYLSQCPNCSSIHQLTIVQMNIANGLVRCAHCQHSFDAYLGFVMDPAHKEETVNNVLFDFYAKKLAQDDTLHLKAAQNLNPLQQQIFALMQQTTAESSLTLSQYLDFLENFNPLYQQHDSYKASSS